MRIEVREVAFVCMVGFFAFCTSGCFRATSVKYLNITPVQMDAKLNTILISIDQNTRKKTFNKFMAVRLLFGKELKKTLYKNFGAFYDNVVFQHEIEGENIPRFDHKLVVTLQRSAFDYGFWLLSGHDAYLDLKYEYYDSNNSKLFEYEVESYSECRQSGLQKVCDVILSPIIGTMNYANTAGKTIAIALSDSMNKLNTFLKSKDII